MKATKFQRITALLLAFLCLFGGMTVSASASTAKSADSEDSMLANIKELLNAISYNEYVQLEEYVKASPAKSPVTVLGTEGTFFDDAGKEVSYEDNKYVLTANPLADAETNKAFDRLLPGIFTDTTVAKEGIYLPDTGKVEWEISEITESAKYNMYIEYYPIDNKSADVERIFLVNGEVPFAEAR